MMTVQNPTYGQPPMVPQTRLSKSSLTSLIMGILGCIPFLTGALAILLGIIGFVRTGAPGVRGRWMAIVGTVLGVISVGVWSIMAVTAGGVIGMVFSVLGMMAAPKAVAHDFIRDLAAHDIPALKAHSTSITDAELEGLSKTVQEKGTFTDTTFTNQNMRNNEATFQGTAAMSKGELEVGVHLTKEGNDWKVDGIQIK